MLLNEQLYVPAERGNTVYNELQKEQQIEVGKSNSLHTGSISTPC